MPNIYKMTWPYHSKHVEIFRRRQQNYASSQNSWSVIRYLILKQKNHNCRHHQANIDPICVVHHVLGKRQHCLGHLTDYEKADCDERHDVKENVRDVTWFFLFWESLAENGEGDEWQHEPKGEWELKEI